MNNIKNKNPKVLLVSAEAAPLSKTGGLADVVGALPKALATLDVDARVITPYHRVVKEKYADKVELISNFHVYVGWRRHAVLLYSLNLDGVTYYLVGNDFYFGDKIYMGKEFEGEQYAFFCIAVLETLFHIDFMPDVLHCNDWHSGMIPMLIKTKYRDSELKNIKTLVSIHNLAYQGKFTFELFRDWFGVEDKYFTHEYIELYGYASFIKAGCIFADKLSTVSPNYADEICTPLCGEKLEGVLSMRKNELYGILNGIDTVKFNPETDVHLPFNYSATSMHGKKLCKHKLLSVAGIEDFEAPVFSMVTRLVDQKGLDILLPIIDEIIASKATIVILGSGNKDYEDALISANERHAGKFFAKIGYDEDFAQLIYAGSDVFLMPSLFEPCGLSQMISMRYGTLPLVRSTGGLADSVISYFDDKDTATGFKFSGFNTHEFLDCVKAVIEIYNDKSAFSKIIENAMATDFSFIASASEYLKLYSLLTYENLSENFHNSSDFNYRAPLGAVVKHENIRLMLHDFSLSSYAKCYLKLEDEIKSFNMLRNNFDYELELQISNLGAYEYYFEVFIENKVLYVSASTDGYTSTLSSELGSGFRLTVYSDEFTLPSWFNGATMYQIFPDRFSRDCENSALNGIEYHKNLGRNIRYHENWSDRPESDINTPEGLYMPIDFFGGTLRGISEKLPYFNKLGITVLYLNPIFEACSNHRYDAADYMSVDPILGTNEDFINLCDTAADYGIKIILDVAFSHTGADSIYFNKYSRYPSIGAYNDEKSPYYSWYDFEKFPDLYRSWWGFSELPEVDELNEAWEKFIISNENCVIKTWLSRGAYGYRLDVADELPDSTLMKIRKFVKEKNPEALIIGEVWEDAVTKFSYGYRRKYALGEALDTVMNYPLRTALLDFLQFKSDAYALHDFLLSQCLNYPKPMYYGLMNLVSSHDVSRVSSVLDISMHKLVAFLQYILPGVPSLYYGDENCMKGVTDPHNRGAFHETDTYLLSYYEDLGELRRNSEAIKQGTVAFCAVNYDVITILRHYETEALLFCVNRSNSHFEAQVDVLADFKGMDFSELQSLSNNLSDRFIDISIEPRSSLVIRLN